MAGQGRVVRTKPGDPTTEKQQQVLGYIISYHRLNGCPATVRQIADAFGWKHPNSVMCHLKALAAKGKIRKSGPGRFGHYVAAFSGNCCSVCGQQLPQASPN